MIVDNRLDFINNIDENCIAKMTDLRGMFIALDGIIANQRDKMPSEAGIRSVDLARQYLEISLQYTIKSMCILGEK